MCGVCVGGGVGGRGGGGGRRRRQRLAADSKASLLPPLQPTAPLIRGKVGKRLLADPHLPLLPIVSHGATDNTLPGSPHRTARRGAPRPRRSPAPAPYHPLPCKGPNNTASARLTALLVGGPQVHEQLEGLVNHPVAAGGGAVHLVHHNHHLERAGWEHAHSAVELRSRGAQQRRQRRRRPAQQQQRALAGGGGAPQGQRLVQSARQQRQHSGSTAAAPNPTCPRTHPPSCSAPAPCAAQSGSGAWGPPRCQPAAARRRPC